MKIVRVRQHQRVHRGVGAHALAQADHLVDVVAVQVVRAERAAQHAVGVAHVHHHRADQRVAAAHLDLRVRLRHAPALGEAVVLLPVVAIALVELGIDDVEVLAGHDAQAVALDALRSSTAGRPTRIGRASPSSTTTCTARSTRSSSPSA